MLREEVGQQQHDWLLQGPLPVELGDRPKTRARQKGHFKRAEIATADLVKDLESGLTRTEIARRRKITRPTVDYRLKQAGVFVPKYRKGFSKRLPWDEKIVPMYSDGQSVKAIAVKMGASTQTINRGLHARGIILRDKTAHSRVMWAERKAKLLELERLLARKLAAKKPGRRCLDGIGARLVQLRHLKTPWDDIPAIIEREFGLHRDVAAYKKQIQRFRKRTN